MTRHDGRRERLTRRAVVLALGIGGTAAAAGMLPASAWADAKAAQELVQKIAKGAAAKEGKITIKAPEIAENGNTVPVTLAVDSPMTAADHVKAVHLIAEENPLPGVASFNFAPDNGKAEVEVRIRLARSQKLIALAEMSDGSLWRATREVKVTIGGCGG